MYGKIRVQYNVTFLLVRTKSHGRPHPRSRKSVQIRRISRYGVSVWSSSVRRLLRRWRFVRLLRTLELFKLLLWIWVETPICAATSWIKVIYIQRLYSSSFQFHAHTVSYILTYKAACRVCGNHIVYVRSFWCFSVFWLLKTFWRTKCLLVHQ